MVQSCQNEMMPYPYLCFTLMKELAFNPKREQELEIKNFEIESILHLAKRYLMFYRVTTHVAAESKHGQRS